MRNEEKEWEKYIEEKKVRERELQEEIETESKNLFIAVGQTLKLVPVRYTEREQL